MSIIDQMSEASWRVLREAEAHERLMFRLREFQAGLTAQRIRHHAFVDGDEFLTIRIDMKLPPPIEGPLPVFASSRGRDGRV